MTIHGVYARGFYFYDRQITVLLVHFTSLAGYSRGVTFITRTWQQEDRESSTTKYYDFASGLKMGGPSSYVYAGGFRSSKMSGLRLLPISCELFFAPLLLLLLLFLKPVPTSAVVLTSVQNDVRSLESSDDLETETLVVMLAL